jgi:putative flavoprotein involved in K+ transport
VSTYATPQVPGPEPSVYDVIVIGGGQAGLAAGYYLRRSGLTHVILDAQEGPGGAWRHGWDSLALFSPAQWSSLPGWIMPGGTHEYPGRDAVLAYMAEYERRYNLPVHRPVRVSAVRPESDSLLLDTDSGIYTTRTVISATGSWEQPYIPHYPGRDLFRGMQIHSAYYRSPAPFAGKRVLIVGGGNSGAQILAELSQVATPTWVARRPPVFMPDDVDGRYLFDVATRQYQAQVAADRGDSAAADSLRATVTGGLGNIVMVPPVKEVRDRGVLHTVLPFTGFTETGVKWSDGTETPVNAVIWCTGFRHALGHLRPLERVMN